MQTQTKILLIVFPIYLALISLIIIINFYGLWDIFGKLIIFISLMAIGISASVFVALWAPRKKYQLKDWDNPNNKYVPDGYDKSKWNILLDTHFHTKYSDGVLNVEQAVKWHLAMGFNAFFITDHDNIDSLDDIEEIRNKYKNQIIIIPGIEIASENCHMNILGIEEWNQDWIEGTNPKERIESITKIAHEKGAVVTINHYPWSTLGKKPRISPKIHPTREQALEWGIDFIEASNWDDDIECIDNISYEFCQAHENISPVAGTDVHVPDKDKLWGWTLLNVSEFSQEAIMEELRNHRTEVLFKRDGIPYPTKHVDHWLYKILRPFYQIGDLFLSFHKGGSVSNIDWLNVLSWIGYSLIFFIIIENLF